MNARRQKCRGCTEVCRHLLDGKLVMSWSPCKIVHTASWSRSTSTLALGPGIALALLPCHYVSCQCTLCIAPRARSGCITVSSSSVRVLPTSSAYLQYLKALFCPVRTLPKANHHEALAGNETRRHLRACPADC